MQRTLRCFVVSALAAVAAVSLFVLSGAAHPTRAAAIEMDFACAQKKTGLLRYVSDLSLCRKPDNQVTIKPGPVYVCVEKKSKSVRRVSAAADCGQKQVVVLPPTSDSVYFCAANGSGRLRYVNGPGQCTSKEFEVIVTATAADDAPSVTSTTPANGATNVAVDANIVVIFNESVTASASGFTLICGGISKAFTLSGSPGSSLTLDPTGDLPQGTSCTVTAVANNISDTDTLDPPDHPTADYAFSFTVVAGPPPPSLSIADASVAEGNLGAVTPLVFTVGLSAASAQTVTVDFATADGTAAAPGDYQAATGTLTFNPGETSKQLTVLVNGDTSVEPDETFLVNLSNATNASVADAQATGTIVNDDGAPPPLPSLSINDLSLNEGNSGTTAFMFTVGLSAGSAQTVTVDFATADGTAVAPGDYTAATGTLTFAPGETSKPVTVQVNGDTSVEADETFTVNLSNATNATIADGQGQGTIVNDDAPPPPLSIDDVSHNEGNSGTTAFTFTVTLSAASAQTVTVDYATADGTAVAPGDYTAASGTLTFAPGETSKPVTVQVNGDTSLEPDETFTVNLSNAANATIADGQGQGAVVNDDVNQPPVDGDESTNAVGNTLLEYGSVPSPSSAPKKVVSGNLLSNATDQDSPPQTLTISASDSTSASGGDVSVSSSGAFSYVPAAGFTGTDTFNYTVSDGNGGTDTSTVTITVASRVWYVKNNATPGGTGRSTDPFDTLAEADTAANQTGDITYVYQGDGTTTGLTGGFSLLASQKLLGEPVDLVVGADTLATGTPANRPSLSGTVALGPGSRVEGVDIAGSGGAAIAGINSGGSDVTDVNLSGGAGGVSLTTPAAGTFNFTNFTITTTGGTGFLVNSVGFSPTINVGSVSTENVSATGDPAVDVRDVNGASSLAFDAVSSTNSSGAGINLDSNGAAPFSASSGSISGAAGNAIDINGGSGNVTYPGTLGNGSGNTADITGRTGGAISLSGDINDTNDAGGGITMSGNTGGSTTFSGATKTLNTGASAAFSSTGSGQTITFSGGGLNIDTTSGAGFSATGGGTVDITGSANTIDSTTGTALNVASTNIGASGLNFQSVSSNGASSGIILNSTGSSGGLTVSGTGSAGTGGTIQNSSDSGILANSTRTPSLSWMNISNNGDAVNEGGVRMTNVTGTGGITSSTVTAGFEDNVYLKNDTTTATFTLQGPSCSITNNNSASGNDGLTLLAATSANVTATVDGCSWSGNRAIAIKADAGDSATMNVTIKNNVITQGSPNKGNQGIEVSNANNGNVTFLVDSNKVGTPDGTTVSPLMNTGINIFNGSAGNAVMAGRVSNNTVLNDPTFAPGSSNGFGIRVFNSNLAQIRAKVTNNIVKNVNADYGILAESSGTAAAPTAPHGRLDVDIESNNVDVNSGALDAIRSQARNFNTDCSKIVSNTTDAGGAGFFGIFVRQANSAVFQLDGWNGAGTPEAFVASQNPSASTTGSIGTITGVPANTCNFTGVP